MTRVIGEEKRAMVTLTARHLPIYLSMPPFISFQQSPGYGEKATSKGRYIPPNGIGARASPKASFNTVSAITMIGRLSGRIVGKVIFAPEHVGQCEDVDLLQGLVERVGLILHTHSRQS